MVDTKAVSVRLPLDLLSELSSYATDKGMVRGGDANIGGAIIAILREHFGQSDNVKQVSVSPATDIDLDSRIDEALEAKVDFSIREISRRADEQYDRLVAFVSDKLRERDRDLENKLNQIEIFARQSQEASNTVASLEATIESLQQSTLDVEAMINDAIAPLLARIEALENTRSEAVAPANFSQALLQKAKEVAPKKLKEVA